MSGRGKLSGLTPSFTLRDDLGELPYERDELYFQIQNCRSDFLVEAASVNEIRLGSYARAPEVGRDVRSHHIEDNSEILTAARNFVCGSAAGDSRRPFLLLSDFFKVLDQRCHGAFLALCRRARHGDKLEFHNYRNCMAQYLEQVDNDFVLHPAPCEYGRGLPTLFQDCAPLQQWADYDLVDCIRVRPGSAQHEQVIDAVDWARQHYTNDRYHWIPGVGREGEFVMETDAVGYSEGARFHRKPADLREFDATVYAGTGVGGALVPESEQWRSSP